MVARIKFGMVVVVLLAAACHDVEALTSGGPDAAVAPDSAPAPIPTPDASDAGETDAAIVTDGPPVDAGATWALYSNVDFSPGTWTQLPLDLVWTGQNAPPPRGIIAIAQLNLFDRLLVWADDGKFYVRADGIWKPPVDTATLFPALVGRSFRGCYHQPNEPAVGVEELVLVNNPVAILYTYGSNDAINFESIVTLADEPAPFGAPKASKQLRWVMRSWNPASVDANGSLAEYSMYEGDDHVYFFDATATPTNKWLFADAPLFAGKTNVPPKADIMAAWRDDKAKTNYLIVK